MKLSLQAIHKFNLNLQKHAEDSFTDPTPEKISLVKLMSSIMSQALADLHNGTEEQQKDVDRYIKSREFDKHCKCLSIDSGLMLRMLLKIDESIIDVDEVENSYDRE